MGRVGGVSVGREWLVDASGCDAAVLKDARALAGLFEELVVCLGLSVVGTPQWHCFGGPGGVTGLALLSESHLAIHTFPEHRYAALSIYSCGEPQPPRPTGESSAPAARPETPWIPDAMEALVRQHLTASHVVIRTLERSAR